MIVAVAGSHAAGIPKSVVVQAIRDSGFQVTKLLSGHAKQVDRYGEAWAKQNGIEVETFEPDWESYGKPAGPIRNSEIIRQAEALVLVWDGQSSGSYDIRSKAVFLKRPVYEVIWDKEVTYADWVRYQETLF